MNSNLYHGGIATLNPDVPLSPGLDNRKNYGPFAFPVIEFHRPDATLGFMLHAGYDSRKGSFNDNASSSLAYFSIEPSLRLNLFHTRFYLYSGPRFAFNTDKRFTIQQESGAAATGGVLGDVKNTIISMQVGGGYDFPLTSAKNKSQVILSPFVAFHPYLGQSPRSIEGWNVTTLRAGIALKFGRGHILAAPEQFVPVVVAVGSDASDVVTQPQDIPLESPAEVVSPLRNSVYFDLRLSDQIHSDVKEEQNMMAMTTPEVLSDPEQRKMITQGNFISVLGELLVKNPSASIMLSGAAVDGPKDGLEMAESVKLFLTDVFGIGASRFVTKGQKKLKINPRHSNEKFQLAMLHEGRRRVLIETNSRILTTELRDALGIQLTPLKNFDVLEAATENFVTFKTEGSKEDFTSWTLELTDERGKMQNYGPFTRKFVSIPGKSILGTRSEGNFQVSILGVLKNGQTVKTDTTAHLVLWTPPTPEKVARFSIIYEFNNAKAISIYDRYLTDVVTPKIPNGATVVIHGHTDMAGGDDYNLKLFLSRVNDARKIIERALAKSGRNDINFEVHGFGEDQLVAPFEHKKEGESFSNRTIIIDIVSGVK
jgi:hypothetical protein